MSAAPRIVLHGLWPATVAFVLGAAAAVPTGRALGQWVIFGDLGIAAELARYWVAIPGAIVIAAAIGLWLRAATGAARLAAPIVLAVLVALGAWQGLSDRVNAYRDGPLNEAL